MLVRTILSLLKIERNSINDSNVLTVEQNDKWSHNMHKIHSVCLSALHSELQITLKQGYFG